MYEMVQVKLYDFLYGNAGYLFLLCGGSPGGNPLKQIRYTVSTVLHLAVHQVFEVDGRLQAKIKNRSDVCEYYDERIFTHNYKNFIT